MVVIGLGNPGSEYAQTRHNAGFLLLEAARTKWRGESWRRRGNFEESHVRLAGGGHRLIRPLTYMNCSGEVLERLLREGVHADDLLVALDDVDLPLGRIRIRAQGSAGGHRGLQSILDELGTQAVARLRIGVGRPGDEDVMVDHVLSGFDAQERERFAQVLDRARAALHVIIRQGVQPAMTRFNGLRAPWEEAAERAARRETKTDDPRGGE